MKASLVAIAAALVLSVIRMCIRSKIFHSEIYEKTFVCPSCGARFSPKWYHLVLQVNSVYAFNEAKLKCPVCHKKDICSVAYDER